MVHQKEFSSNNSQSAFWKLHTAQNCPIECNSEWGRGTCYDKARNLPLIPVIYIYNSIIIRTMNYQKKHIHRLKQNPHLPTPVFICFLRVFEPACTFIGISVSTCVRTGTNVHVKVWIRSMHLEIIRSAHMPAVDQRSLSSIWTLPHNRVAVCMSRCWGVTMWGRPHEDALNCCIRYHSKAGQNRKEANWLFVSTFSDPTRQLMQCMLFHARAYLI